MPSSNHLFSGPYTLDADWPFVAYLSFPHGSGQRPALCFVAHKDEAQWLANNPSRLVEIACAYIAGQFADWQTVRCFSATLQPGSEELAFEICEEAEGDPAQMARAVLRKETLNYRRTVNGREFLITEYAREEGNELKTFRVQPVGDSVGFPVHLRNSADLDLALSFASESALDAQHSAMYLWETLSFLQQNDVVAAFRAYYYALLFGAALDLDVLLEAGLLTAGRLLKAGQFDYADWVADTVARRAENEGRREEAAKALQMAGIAASALGRAEEACGYFQRALAQLGDATDLLVKIRVHMSFGLALVELMAHWETDPLYTNGDYDGFATEKMALAVEQLQTAHGLIGTPDDEGLKHMQCAIELDLIRSQDLLGDSEGALARLDELTHGPRFLRTDKLVATALLYRAAILKKLSEKNPGRHPAYLAFLDEASQMLAGLSRKPGDRLCCFQVLRADALMRQGKFRQALEELTLASLILSERQKGNVRPPGPGVEYGGLPVIDVGGKLQAAYLALARADAEGAYAWKAMQIADAAKGRHFCRDLTLAVSAKPETFSAYVAAQHHALRSNLLRGGGDPRILKADYEWFVGHELDSGQAALLREQGSFAQGVEPEEATELLALSGEKTAFLSFYALGQETYVYLLTEPGLPPDVATLAVDARALEEAVAGLNVGISGNKRYKKIEPDKPHLKDKYFNRLLDLQGAFSHLASYLAGFDRIIISPHGQWHGLPIHALLSPAFWKLGTNPGIGYAPSIHGFRLLQRRASETVALRPIGLATVPAKENTAALFRQAHQSLAAVFRQASQGLLEMFGTEATPSQALEQLNQVGVQHILAHGRYESHGKVMDSGVMLAGGQGLPSQSHIDIGGTDLGSHLLSGMGVMASGIRAGHVTLQACSLGRAQPAHGDELWGLTRALLAAGTGSVLAPMWDIDVVSSTALLARFYENWLVKGQTKWAALAEAQQHLACASGQSAWAHFYHWAPFQLAGC